VSLVWWWYFLIFFGFNSPMYQSRHLIWIHAAFYFISRRTGKLSPSPSPDQHYIIAWNQPCNSQI
jgi:hypothetical protein